ncbi:MAG: class IV adenylate cyclase [Chrysiogenia bacterium]
MITENPVEIEVKISVERLEPWREKLLRLEAVLEYPRVLERNLVFDTSRRRLKKRGVLLRLRRLDSGSILTMKMPAQESSQYKIREEIETGVSDFANMEKILLGIGFKTFFVYEKYREVLKRKGIRIMLDETPIGNFLEIEGEPAAIDAMAAELGFSAKDYITCSYHWLFLRSGRSGNMEFQR